MKSDKTSRRNFLKKSGIVTGLSATGTAAMALECLITGNNALAARAAVGFLLFL